MKKEWDCLLPETAVWFGKKTWAKIQCDREEKFGTLGFHPNRLRLSTITKLVLERKAAKDWKRTL